MGVEDFLEELSGQVGPLEVEEDFARTNSAGVLGLLSKIACTAGSCGGAGSADGAALAAAFAAPALAGAAFFGSSCPQAGVAAANIAAHARTKNCNPS